MANTNKFTCGASTYTIDQAINGQSGLAFYDPLAQIALRPSLREGTILCYWKQGLEGLLSQVQSMMKSDNRMVKTNPYYWTEYCAEETITIQVIKSPDAVPAAGAAVTVTIDPGSHSRNGKFSRPRTGYRVYFKELPARQGANITNVTKTVSGAHTIEFTPLNGEVLDLTKLSTYTVVIDTLKMYQKGDTTCLTGSGLVQSPPVLRKGYVQKFEDMISIHEDEIDGYVYENEFQVVKGISPVTGKAVDMWCAPQVTEQLLGKVIDNKLLNTLIGVRDDTRQEGFDGLITTAEKAGSYQAGYEVGSGISLRNILMNNIRTLRKTNGCTDILMAHDFGFGIDWTEGLAAMVGNANQNYKFALFGDGGKGNQGAFEWYQFTDFKAFGYQFRSTLIDAMDARRYGELLPNFAITMPGCQFKDTNGKAVPPVTYVNIEGCEPAKQDNFKVDDTRVRNCRYVNYSVKTSYGMEIHCASKLGVLKRARCA